jgi:predicted nucleic acid-binding protein
VKRRRLSVEGMMSTWIAASAFKVSLVDVDMAAALRLAAAHNIYAYDAYILECALEHQAKLLTLDRRMGAVGLSLGLDVSEA